MARQLLLRNRPVLGKVRSSGYGLVSFTNIGFKIKGLNEQGEVMAITVIQNRLWKKRESVVVDQQTFGKKVGLIWKFLGCGHSNLSRPISRGKIGYRSCLKCGALKPFNTDTLMTSGDFYYPPIIKVDLG